MSIEELNKKINEVRQDDNVLSVIKGYGDVLANLEKSIREKEEEVKSLKKEQKQIAEQTLPDIMDDAGINEVTLANGTKIECKDYIFARIKDEFTAFKYLRDKGEDSIIDNRIQINLPKGFEQAAQMLMGFLEQNNLQSMAQQKKSVHFKRLESWVRDALEREDLDDLPRNAFGVYEGRKVIFK
jgi:hypothetical protein